MNACAVRVTATMRELGALAAIALAAAGCADEVLDPVSYEDQVVIQLEQLRAEPGALHALLAEMPKGGDLHNHLLGAVPVQTLLQWGAEDGFCAAIDGGVVTVTSPPCVGAAVPMAEASPGSALYHTLFSTWSMVGFQGDVLARHDHFFPVFTQFDPLFTEKRFPQGIAETATLAAQNHQQYLELMHDFNWAVGGNSDTAGNLAIAAAKPGAAWDQANLLAIRSTIIADPAFATAVASAKNDIETWRSEVATMLGCDTASPAPGCGVDVRWVFAGCRYATREYVFGQWVFAYELAQVEPDLVGVNLVKPEEEPNSLEYYDDEMNALGVLRAFNEATPGRRPLHISLHAGELIPAVLPADMQDQLTFHIRDAVELAGAERIGHGVDVLGETRGAGVDQLLGELADRHVLVEINLTSNALLLGVEGAAHPFSSYRRHGVPVALSTDDEGLFGSDITTDYVRAVTQQGAGYLDFKQMARASIDHAFLPGDSLWTGQDTFESAVPACAGVPLGQASPPASCSAFLSTSERAQ
jgi:adenosine deaminase